MWECLLVISLLVELPMKEVPFTDYSSAFGPMELPLFEASLCKAKALELRAAVLSDRIFSRRGPECSRAQ